MPCLFRSFKEGVGGNGQAIVRDHLTKCWIVRSLNDSQEIRKQERRRRYRERKCGKEFNNADNAYEGMGGVKRARE